MQYTALQKLAEDGNIFSRGIDNFKQLMNVGGGINKAMDVAKDYRHLLVPGAVGAGLGGLSGLALTPVLEHPEREKRHWIRNMLLAMLAGGGAGTAAGYFKPESGRALADHLSSYNPFKE